MGIAYRAEEKTSLSDQAGTARTRRDLLGQAIETALSGAGSVTQGASKQPRRIHRLQPDDKAPPDGVALRLRSGWDEDLTAVEKIIAAAPTDRRNRPSLIPRHRSDELGARASHA